MSTLRWTPKPIPGRLPGWDKVLVARLEHILATPFAWGISDCLTSAADVCEAMTGVQPFPKGLRRYRTAEGAQRLLFKLGFNDVSGPLETIFRPIPQAMARRGDVAVRRIAVHGVETLTTFIVLGNGMAVGKQEGVAHTLLPVLQLDRAYAIGWEQR